MSETESQQRPDAEAPRNDFRRGGIVVVIGLWLLATTTHLGGLEFWNSWPWLLVLLGIVNAIFPQGRTGPISGLLLTAWGVLAAIAVNKWWGFGWFDIWPLFLVVVGVEMVINAIVSQRRPRGRTSEVNDE